MNFTVRDFCLKKYPQKYLRDNLCTCALGNGPLNGYKYCDGDIGESVFPLRSRFIHSLTMNKFFAVAILATVAVSFGEKMIKKIYL